MGQLGSKILHKIPYNMAWENNIFYNAPAWNAVLGSQLSTMLTKRLINFTIHRKKHLWSWKSSCSVSQHGVALLIYKAFLSERYKHYSLDFYEKDLQSVEFFLKNAYNGKNPARPGKVFFFEMYNKIFCVNCFAQKLLPPKVLNRNVLKPSELTSTKKSFFTSTQARTTSSRLYVWRLNWQKVTAQTRNKSTNNYKVLKFPAMELVAAKLFAGWLQITHEIAQQGLKLPSSAPVSKFVYPRSPWLRYFNLFLKKISFRRLQRFTSATRCQSNRKRPAQINLNRAKKGILKVNEILKKNPPRKFKTVRKIRTTAKKKLYTPKALLGLVKLLNKKTPTSREHEITTAQPAKPLAAKRAALKKIGFAREANNQNPVFWLYARRLLNKKTLPKKLYVYKKKTRRQFLRTLTRDRAPALFILKKTYSALNLKQLKLNKQPAKSMSQFF